MEDLSYWFVIGSIATVVVAMASEWVLFGTARVVRLSVAPAVGGFAHAVSELRLRLSQHASLGETERADSVVQLRQSWMRVQDQTQVLSFDEYKRAILEVEALRSELEAQGVEVA